MHSSPIDTTAASLPDIQNAQFLYNPVSQDVIAGDILELQCIAVGRLATRHYLIHYCLHASLALFSKLGLCVISSTLY